MKLTPQFYLGCPKLVNAPNFRLKQAALNSSPVFNIFPPFAKLPYGHFNQILQNKNLSENLNFLADCLLSPAIKHI